MSLETLLSYNIIPIEGLSSEVVNSLFLLFLSSILVSIAVYILSHRGNRDVDPIFRPQVEAVRAGLDDAPHVPQTDRLHNQNQDSCPICMNPPTLPIETNCGHVFCINCFTMYWTHVGDFQTTKCPMCRSRVTLLMLTQPIETYTGDRANLEKVETYNRRHSGQPRSLLEQLFDTPAFLRHLFREFFTPGMLRLTYMCRVMVILLGLVIYVISPLDILPESVFGIFGLLDDILVAVFLLCLLGNMYRAFVLHRVYRDWWYVSGYVFKFTFSSSFLNIVIIL